MLAALASVWLAASGDIPGHPALAAFTAAFAAALATLSLTGAWPRPAATLMAGLVAGVLALAAHSALPPWTVPQRFGELGLLTSWATGAFTAIYLLSFLATLISKDRPPSLPASCALLAVPFLFNLLLALDSKSVDGTGRGLILWLFNAVVVVGTAWVIDHRGTRSWRIHAILPLAALMALVTPFAADFGSGARLAGSPAALRLLGVAAAGAASQAGLWGEVFLVTGVLLDALRGRRPTARSCLRHWTAGLGRGAIFGAVYMLLAHAAVAGATWSALASALRAYPLLAGSVLGALLFPLVRTLVESFDGSQAFFVRLARAYRDPMNAWRGLCTGAALALAIGEGLPGWSEGTRFLAGFGIGALGYGGADLLRDLGAVSLHRRQRLQSARLYVVGILLGGVVGGSLAWYFDPAQLGVVTEKVHQYAEATPLVAVGQAQPYVVYPLFSKWGALDLGNVIGGVRLLWSESMAGVINWAIAAPLFGINIVLLAALFERSLAPLRELFSGAGLVAVFEQTVRVLRWGPWMAPIIFTFLRLSPQPTWYNQDGLVHTLVAIVQSASLSPSAFAQWSLQCFLALLAYDWLRVLIWFDHMGLRVATLVNLSFVGGDALDEKTARFLGQSVRSRVIPEGIRRFFTWAPLLLPFYLPRGADWDTVWTGAERLLAHPAPLLPAAGELVLAYAVVGGALAVLVAGTLIVRRRLGLHTPPHRPPPFAYRLGNGLYTLELDPDGAGYSHVESALRPGHEIDLTRRPDDRLQLRGKWFWLREMTGGVAEGEAWSLTSLPSGHPDVRYSAGQPRPSRVRFVAERGDLRVEAEVEVPVDRMLEVWRLRIHNASERPRSLDITSYRELAVAATDSYRRSAPFAAMHVRTCFLRPFAAILARNRQLHDRRDRSSPEVAFHAVDADGDRVQLLGYEDSRLDFIGTGTLRRAAVFAERSLRQPEDEGGLYTFDPIASLRVQARVPARGSSEVRFVDGYAADADGALRMLAQAFGRPLPGAEAVESCFVRERRLRQFDRAASGGAAFSADGMEVRAPVEAARAWTHVLANELGHGAVLGADGDFFVFGGNAQQNALTAGQLLALVDLDSGERLNATLIPFRARDASREAVFGLGYASFRSRRAGLELEETIVLPHDAPLLLRELRIRNSGSRARRFRAVIFAEIVLAETPIDSLGRIEVREDAGETLLFRNAQNDFAGGWAFVATSLPQPTKETVRARFLGDACDMADAHFLLHGSGELGRADDGRRCAAFAGPLELRPGEVRRVNVVVGQAPSYGNALELAGRFRHADARGALRATSAWWAGQLGVLHVETDRPELDRLVNTWLPYQVLAARLWGRCGPQQRGGAFGFRDQLQDVLPIAWTHPRLARRQILLHAAQQFREGDVLAWWHSSSDDRTGIGARTAASDPHLWLPYVVAQYVRASGDRQVLRENLPFLEGSKLPRGERGIVLAPRTSRDRASLYEHCRRAIDRALARTSPRGLPLIGSGDWNDGLNALGLRGRGESVWLGFFLHDVLRRFAPLAEGEGDASSARRYEAAAAQLRRALDLTWRHGSYARATSDEGSELRFASCLMGAWPALSGGAPEDRAERALSSALAVLERDERVLLLAPPFDERAKPYPGSIAEYPPGVRENGGQYSHGASWLVDAWLHFAEQAAGRGDAQDAARCRGRAWEIWWKISPLSKTEPLYGLPPHQQPADVYDGPGYAGRGGWAWYTGAAARMLHAAYRLLGLDMQDGGDLQVRAFASAAGVPRLRRLRFHGRELPLR